MDTTVLLLATMTVTLIGVALNAWRIGNDRRDVVLLAVFAGLFGAGTAAAAVL